MSEVKAKRCTTKQKVLFRRIENALLELTKDGYSMFVNDGNVQFFKGNPPRDRWGAVIPDKACYICSHLINADGGATA